LFPILIALRLTNYSHSAQIDKLVPDSHSAQIDKLVPDSHSAQIDKLVPDSHSAQIDKLVPDSHSAQIDKLVFLGGKKCPKSNPKVPQKYSKSDPKVSHDAFPVCLLSLGSCVLYLPFVSCFLIKICRLVFLSFFGFSGVKHAPKMQTH
jgi:hypothetical protein